MNIPQFNAEASLGPAMGVYRGNNVFGGSGSFQILPSQTPNFQVNRFPVMRCCGYVQWLGRFVCTSRSPRIFETCECIRSPDGFPFILCRDIVNFDEVPIVNIDGVE